VYRGNGGTDLRVLIVGTRWRLMFSIKPHPPSLWKRAPCEHRVSGHLETAARRWENNIKIVLKEKWCEYVN